MSPLSRKIDVSEIQEAIDNISVDVAGKTTRDGTQRVRIRYTTKGVKLERRYTGQPGVWDIIQEGGDLDEIVRVYNGMS